MMNFNLLGTQLCNFCIKAMKYGCATLGISYGLLNILLFIVIEPLCILLFAIAAIMYMKFRKSEDKIKRIIAHCIFGAGVVFTLIDLLICLLCIYGALAEVGSEGSSITYLLYHS